jgi:hypothetical protein
MNLHDNSEVNFSLNAMDIKSIQSINSSAIDEAEKVFLALRNKNLKMLKDNNVAGPIDSTDLIDNRMPKCIPTDLGNTIEPHVAWHVKTAQTAKHMQKPSKKSETDQKSSSLQGFGKRIATKSPDARGLLVRTKKLVKGIRAKGIRAALNIGEKYTAAHR